MDVLRNMVEAVVPGGLVLDLQVIRPNGVVEADGSVLCEVDGAALFRRADAARVAIDSLVGDGRLFDEAAVDHDVLSHYVSGASLVDYFADGKLRRLPEAELPRLRAFAGPCIVRERCRLRRLRVR